MHFISNAKIENFKVTDLRLYMEERESTQCMNAFNKEQTEHTTVTAYIAKWET